MSNTRKTQDPKKNQAATTAFVAGKMKDLSAEIKSEVEKLKAYLDQEINKFYVAVSKKVEDMKAVKKTDTLGNPPQKKSDQSGRRPG